MTVYENEEITKLCRESFDAGAIAALESMQSALTIVLEINPKITADEMTFIIGQILYDERNRYQNS